MKGKLLIVGGALTNDNKEVYESFIKMEGGKNNAVIGIISAASSDPLKSASIFKNELTKFYNMSETQINVLPIYCEDYAKNTLIGNIEATDKYLKAINTNLDMFTGIWFTGGDQRKIVQLLYYKEGKETQLLQSIRKIYSKGAVIAGTSAGAAVMNDPIITGGNNRKIVLNTPIRNFYDIEKEDNSTLSIGRGLGLFKYGIIDQHFGERDRIGRLSAACLKIDNAKFGYGIDENTAIMLDDQTKVLKVIGRGGLTIIDTRKSEVDNKIDRTYINNIKLSYLLQGDKYNLNTNSFVFLGEKQNKRTEKYINSCSISPYTSTFLTFTGLISDSYIKEYLISNSTYDSKNIIKEKLVFRFTKDYCNKIYLNKEEKCLKYSAESVNMDIEFNRY